jgi:AcrR family transcriptional regulator
MSSVPDQDPKERQAEPPRRGRPGYDLASVLAVAVEIFNERGYDGTSMRDLAGRLGIAKSAIYHHVAGKEELLRLALDRALAGLSALADRTRVLPAPAIERLEYLVRGSVEVLQAELPYVTLLLRVRGNTEVERAALDQRRSFDRFVAELVAQAVRDGDFRPDADAMITARLLFGLVNSVVEWYRPAPPEDTRSQASDRSLPDAICAMAFDGLRTRRGPAERRSLGQACVRDIDAGRKQLRLSRRGASALVEVGRRADEQGAPVRSAKTTGENPGAGADLIHDLTALAYPDGPAVMRVSDPHRAFRVESASVRSHGDAC